MTRAGIEEIVCGSELLAIIVPAGFRERGIHFFTPNDLSQQLAYMSHPAGRRIAAHVHNPIPRQIHYTQEVLVVRRGKLRVDFYDAARRYFQSRLLGAGDVILLISGGHGFEVVEDVEMIEIKQGPYFGDQDKTRIAEADAAEIRVSGPTS